MHLPQVSIPLPPRVVHLWFAKVDLVRGQPSRLRSSLSPAELIRADGFRSKPDRDRFILIHAWLRRLLGSYLGEEPLALRFTYGQAGKPVLAGDRPPLHFNLSHCVDRVIAAVRRDAEVGIDLERIDPQRVDLGIAARLFSPQENQRLRTSPDAQRPERFFRAWTRLEASAKAVGTGLARYGSVDVPLAVRSFRPAPGMVAAVASPGNDWIAARAPISSPAEAGRAGNT